MTSKVVAIFRHLPSSSHSDEGTPRGEKLESGILRAQAVQIIARAIKERTQPPRYFEGFTSSTYDALRTCINVLEAGPIRDASRFASAPILYKPEGPAWVEAMRTLIDEARMPWLLIVTHAEVMSYITSKPDIGTAIFGHPVTPPADWKPHHGNGFVTTTGEEGTPSFWTVK